MASPNYGPHTTRYTTPRTHLHPTTHTRGRPNSGTATPEGSATTTITATPPHSDTTGLVLRLRGAHDPETTTAETTETTQPRRIQWAEGTIDNEGLGRKKSKVCCIYHKTREFGESSSEEDSSSSEESDGGSGDDGAARPVGGYKAGSRRGKKGRGHKHEDEDGCDGHDHGHGGAKGGRKPSPNAYERMPRYDVKPLERQPGS